MGLKSVSREVSKVGEMGGVKYAAAVDFVLGFHPAELDGKVDGRGDARPALH